MATEVDAEAEAEAKVTPGPTETLVDRILPTRARIPDRPPAGDYVVADVTHFSTTVVELLSQGAASFAAPAHHRPDPRQHPVDVVWRTSSSRPER